MEVEEGEKFTGIPEEKWSVRSWKNTQKNKMELQIFCVNRFINIQNLYWYTFFINSFRVFASSVWLAQFALQNQNKHGGYTVSFHVNQAVLHTFLPGSSW